MPVADVGRVTRLCRVDNPISLEQVLQAECEDREELGESHLAMAHHGCPRPQRGGGPLVVEGGSDAAGLELGPVAEVEAGAVQEVVVRRGEAVHQVQRQAAQEGGESVLDDPPGLGQGDKRVTLSDDRLPRMREMMVKMHMV